MIPLNPAQVLTRNGIGFDWQRYAAEILTGKRAEAEQLLAELSQQLSCPKAIVEESTQLIWQLYRHQLYPASLGLEWLKKNRDQHPVYELLYRYKRLRQFLTQYGDRLQRQVQADGRIHAQWQMDGAKTGRMVSSNPNLQAFPRKLHQYFVPAEGNCLIHGDYSQIELRVLAQLSDDSNLLQAFRNNQDIHFQTAAALLQKNPAAITEEERALGKRVNFGICYGISAYGLCKAAAKHGIVLTQQEADAMKKGFYDTYPQVRRYHDHLLTSSVITSLGGRQWIDYPKGIARVNLPVQGSAAEGMKLVLEMLVEQLPEDCLLVNAIHDEIVLECPQTKAGQAEQLLHSCMVTGMQKLITKIPVKVTIIKKQRRL